MTPTIPLIEKRAQRSASKRRSGFTLIEIGVALAIFIIGALAIIRIFPPALGVIQNSGDRQVAIGMNRKALADYESKAGQVPDSVIDRTGTTGGVAGRWIDYPAAVVGTRNGAPLGVEPSLPARPLTPGQEDTASTGHFQYIIGERQRVLVDRANTPFILTRFPFTTRTRPNFVAPAAGNINVRVYRERELEGVTIDPEGKPDFTDAKIASDGTSFSDPSNPTRPLENYPSSTTTSARGGDCVYYVSYRWKEKVNNVTRIQGVVDEPIIFPSNTDTTAWSVTSGPGQPAKVLQGFRLPGQDIVDGPVSVRFRQLIGNIPVNTPPLAGETSLDDARRGVVRLMVGGNNLAVAGETVSVDYMARDWGLLVEDNAPDANQAQATTVLPVRNLMDEVNDSLDEKNPLDKDPQDVLLCSLLMIPVPNTNQITLQRMQVVSDPSGGFKSDISFDHSTNNLPATRYFKYDQRDNDPTDNNDPVRDDLTTGFDFKRGLITVDTQDHPMFPNPVAVLPPPRLRTVYSTLDRWTHQVSVASRSYLPFYPVDSGFTAPGYGAPQRGNATGLYPDSPYQSAFSDTTSAEPWREYVWYPSQNGDRSYLYFHPSEAGKTVMVSYEYQPRDDLGNLIVDAAGNPVFQTVTGGIFTIEDKLIDPPYSILSTYNKPIRGHKAFNARLDLIDQKGNPILPSDLKAILAVQGIGIQARTAWLDGDRFTQTSTVSYRSADEPQ